MSRSHAHHQERTSGLSIFGKDLVRRSGAHCELCDAHRVALYIYEVPPAPKLPDLNDCLMLCDLCLDQIERPNRRDNNHWRCLNHAIWSDVPVVKMLAIAMLQQVAEEEPWALALFEQVYLTDDELRWQAQITLP